VSASCWATPTFSASICRLVLELGVLGLKLLIALLALLDQLLKLFGISGPFAAPAIALPRSSAMLSGSGDALSAIGMADGRQAVHERLNCRPRRFLLVR
jgi:hypothetical protein